MRARLLLLAMLAFVTALLAFRIKQSSHQSTKIVVVHQLTKKIIRCGPDWEQLHEWIEETDIPPITGAGNYKWKISTANDSTQFYFNQGINMYYSFHIIEAMASFKKASRFDPACAMLYWAQALAYGPNINDLGYAASPEALAAAEAAVKHSRQASPKEKNLIAIQALRYSDDSTKSREELNQVYADGMKTIYEVYPTDPDIAALYADALMLQHPWDLWNIDGTPKKWTPAIRNVLEKLLVKTPNHPGANHYYIHVMEASPYADKALPSADRLGQLTPGLSHTVHMPSHIYLRTGNYTKGVTVNEAALKSYNKVLSIYQPAINNAFLYSLHNLHMQTNNAMLAGRSAYTALSARETANNTPTEYLSAPAPMGNYIQYVYGTPVLVAVRFGEWNTLLTLPEPGKEQVFSNILYHFGRGMALSHQSRKAEAKFELEQLTALLKDSSLLVPFTPFSPSIDGATIAQQLLAGTISLKQEQYEEAIMHFQQAATIEENMVYNEPRDWLLNPKHYLGNAYIKAGKPDEAIKVLEKDLLNNKENGWALFGIWQAQSAKKDNAGAAKTLIRFRKAFDKADIKLYGPVF